MIAARQIFLGRGSGGGGWVNPYVTDGLVAMWDGEWNAGGGVHDAGTTTWRELVGGLDLAVSSGIFGGDGLYGTDSTACQATFADASYSLKDIMAADVATTIGCTLEFVCTPLGYSNTPYNMYNAWNLYSVGGNPPPLWSWYKCNSWVDNISARGSIGQLISFSGASTPQTPHPYIQLYSNGEFVNHGAYTPQTAIITDNFNVGLKGAIHSIRIYNRALTAAEIAANYAVDKARFNLP